MITKALGVLAISLTLAITLFNPSNAAAGTKSIDSCADESTAQESLLKAEANLGVLAFSKSKPKAVFARVRNTMADAMEVSAKANVFLSLSEAYAIAVFFHYDVTENNYRLLGLSATDYKHLGMVENIFEAPQYPSTEEDAADDPI